MLTRQVIQVPIWDFRVEVTVFDNIEELDSKYNRYITPGMLALTLEYEGCSRCELLIPSNDYPSMVHELEHIKNLVWKAKGYKPQADNDEPDAYLIGWLFGKVDKIIKKHLA